MVEEEKILAGMLSLALFLHLQEQRQVVVLGEASAWGKKNSKAKVTYNRRKQEMNKIIQWVMLKIDFYICEVSFETGMLQNILIDEHCSFKEVLLVLSLFPCYKKATRAIFAFICHFPL